jgi:hypothetical protein
MKTGVQSIRRVLQTLDSGFRRNDILPFSKGDEYSFLWGGEIRMGLKSKLFYVLSFYMVSRSLFQA